MTVPRVLAALAAALGVASGGLGLVVLRAAGGTVTTWDLIWFAATTVIGLYAVVLGVLVVRRQPDSLVGPLLTLTGAVPCLLGASDTYRLASDLTRSEVVVRLSEGSWMWLYVPAALLALAFPGGRFSSPRRRLVAVGLVVVAAGMMVLLAMAPPTSQSGTTAEPLGRHAWAAPVSFAMVPVFMALLIAAAIAVVRRRRTLDAVGRDRLKWFAIAGMTIPLTLLLCWTSYLLLGNPDLVVVGLFLMYVAVPTATAIAMLRHDLYDVDRVLSGSITYGLVSAGLLTILTLATFVAGLVAPGDSTIAAAAATAVCAALLSPLRNRLQRLVNARLYPLRRGTLAAIDQLRQRTHAGTARPEELEGVLRAAMSDPELRVGYRMPGADTLVDATGNELRLLAATLEPGVAGSNGAGSNGAGRAAADAQGGGVTPVLLGADLVGAISLGRSCPAPLAREITDASALLVEVVRLRRESRAELGTAVAELRQIAHGLRPSSLDDGLGPALSNLTSKVPIPVRLDVRAAGPLPDELTTTAYYVASEAVANTLKHAAAGSVVLQVAQDDGQLRVLVSDDGLGGAVPRAGSGLAGLADRIAALGGTFQVLSPPGGGTTVQAVLPCGS